ncbi:hypothetical protein FRC11_003296, partial [Ceratobasidium sp. 423]
KMGTQDLYDWLNTYASEKANEALADEMGELAIKEDWLMKETALFQKWCSKDQSLCITQKS